MLTIDLSTFPALRTERLFLREIQDADREALFSLRSDPRVMQHIGRTRATRPEDVDALMASIAADRSNNTGISWAIALRPDGPMIGTIGFYRLALEHHRGEVGYMLHPDHWRKGYMREALNAVVEHGFQAIGFHSIEAVTDPLNTASNALLARCGFVREGLFRENFRFEDRYYDSAVWSLLASDRLPA